MSGKGRPNARGALVPLYNIGDLMTLVSSDESVTIDRWKSAGICKYARYFCVTTLGGTS